MRAPILIYDRHAIHIRIDHETHIGFLLLDYLAYFGQILRQGFRIVRKLSVRCAVKREDVLHSQGSQQSRYRYSAYGIDTVDSYLEFGCTDGCHID